MLTPATALLHRAAVPGAAVEALKVELADLSSVRDLAKQITDEGRAYDVVLNNAGRHLTPPRTCSTLSTNASNMYMPLHRAIMRDYDLAKCSCAAQASSLHMHTSRQPRPRPYASHTDSSTLP
jgi:NAD(P)-dependent dehydrogenase (short-subunit alcohol dehydrogenase family)